MLIAANIITFLTYIIHTFGGDREYKKIEPQAEENHKLQEFWTMGRGAFHMVSIDFLFAAVGLTLINFTDYFENKELLLRILAIYFLGYGVAFLITLMISKKFPNSFFKLWQWLLMFILSSLIYWGRVQ